MLASSAQIELKNVFLSLGQPPAEVAVLKDASMRIEAGEAVALLGPSGSGKSTLLMVMTGLEKIDSGAIEVAGHKLATMNEDQLARFRRDEIGIIFQSFHLIPTMTALENVAVPLELAGRKNAFETAADALARVGLKERIHHYPAQLSGGEQQRVAIARAIAPEPKILFADEPTGNLDTATGETIANLIFDLVKESGTTLVLVTHDEALAARTSRIFRMKDARPVEEAIKPIKSKAKVAQ